MLRLKARHNSTAAARWQRMQVRLPGVFSDPLLPRTNEHPNENGKWNYKSKYKYKKILPLGMPQGAFVRALSKKSRSRRRAGGYVRATCASAPKASQIRATAKAAHRRPAAPPTSTLLLIDIVVGCC